MAVKMEREGERQRQTDRDREIQLHWKLGKRLWIRKWLTKTTTLI